MTIEVEGKVKVFTPVKVTIELTTVRELEFFAAMLNASQRNVLDFVNTNRRAGILGFSPEEISTFWDVTTAWRALTDYRRSFQLT